MRCSVVNFPNFTSAKLPRVERVPLFSEYRSSVVQPVTHFSVVNFSNFSPAKH